jgi:hypothetical protein
MKRFLLAATIFGAETMSAGLARAAVVPEYYTVTVEFTSKAGDKQKADFKCHRGKTCREPMNVSIDGKLATIEFFSKAVDEEVLEIRLGSAMITGALIDSVGAFEPYERGKSWQRTIVKTTRRMTDTKLETAVVEKGTVRFTVR